MTVRCPHLALLVRGGGRRACQKVVVQAVEVLLRLYAKCLEGQDEIARRRIVAALGQADHLLCREARTSSR